MQKDERIRRFKFELKRARAEEMINWTDKDVFGNKKQAYIHQMQQKNKSLLQTTDKDELEKLDVMTDRWPCLDCRKAVKRVFIYIHLVAKYTIDTPLFENITIFIIVSNSLAMMVDDPTGLDSHPFFAKLEVIFLVLYSMEMILKILGLGFIMGQQAYLKDSWNILDFIIVGSSYPPYFMDQEAAQDGGLGLSGLRAFRVMRPLRTISSIKGLKVLMQALFTAMPLLIDTLYILMGFFLVFSIGGA